MQSCRLLQILISSTYRFVTKRGGTKIVNLDDMAVHLVGTTLGMDLEALKKGQAGVSEEALRDVSTSFWDHTCHPYACMIALLRSFAPQGSIKRSHPRVHPQAHASRVHNRSPAATSSDSTLSADQKPRGQCSSCRCQVRPTRRGPQEGAQDWRVLPQCCLKGHPKCLGDGIHSSPSKWGRQHPDQRL